MATEPKKARAAKPLPSSQAATPLMPHATATWLVENSSLTFHQIAAFCGIHILEVQAIADETAATKLTARDPLRAGELTQAEIDRGQANPAYRLVLQQGPQQVRRTSGPRYTPLAMVLDEAVLAAGARVADAAGRWFLEEGKDETTEARRAG